MLVGRTPSQQRVCDMVSQTLQPQPEGESTMTNETIVQLYGKLIATTLILDSEIKKKLNKRGFLPDSLVALLA